MKTVLYFKATEKPASLMKLAGALRAARDVGMRVQPVDASGNDRRTIPRLVRFWKPAGLIIDGALADDGMPVPAPPGLPVVYVSFRPRRGKPVFSVCGNAEAIVRAAAQELLALDYPNYAYVEYPKPLAWSKARGKLFHDMVALHGKRQRVFGATGARDSISYVRRLKAWLAALPKPCGIMAANDFTAKSVLDLCTASGIRIPQDIAVVGVDNDENICLNVQPPLSSVLPDMESVGYEAMRLLDRIIRNPRMKPVCVEAGAALMVVRRESSRAHAAYRGDVEKAVALIRARACDGLRARDVVAAMQGSRRYAELAFRNATGHSILDEIQAVRMERARTLVHNSTYTVAAIANLCGYASPSAFGKQYRMAFGTGPLRNRSASRRMGKSQPPETGARNAKQSGRHAGIGSPTGTSEQSARSKR